MDSDTASRVLIALPSPVYRAILQFIPPAVLRLIVSRRILLYRDGPDPQLPADAFEAWLVERWLREIRSEAFQESVDFERLMAEWENGR